MRKIHQHKNSLICCDCNPRLPNWVVMNYILPRGLDLLPFDSNRFRLHRFQTGIGLSAFRQRQVVRGSWFVVRGGSCIFWYFPVLGLRRRRQSSAIQHMMIIRSFLVLPTYLPTYLTLPYLTIPSHHTWFLYIWQSIILCPASSPRGPKSGTGGRSNTMES